MATCRAADVLADTLVAHAVDRVFCVPGESYLALLDALYDRPAVDVVSARHEGGAGFMAMADAKCTGRPGICLVSRGPGATNASIAIHSAEQDATALVVIVGQVNRSTRGRSAFQEMDYARMFGGVAKGVSEITDGSLLAAGFADACALALDGVPGPVVLVVPEDVFEDRVQAPPVEPRPRRFLIPSDDQVAKVAEMLARAERPLLIAGGALDSADGRAALAHVARRHHVPVALSYKRQDLFDNADALFAGYLGFNVPRSLVNGMSDSDLIVAAGTRLGEMTTQHYRLPRSPNPDQPLVHVYPDASPIGRIFTTAVRLVADPTLVLERLASDAPPPLRAGRVEWADRLHACAARLAAYSPSARADGVEFGAVVQAAARHARPDSVISIDGGNFGGWVHRLWPWTSAHRSIGTAGGAMGMGVPGGVSAALRCPTRQVITFVGDGGFMMTGAELATAVHRRANLVVIVSNNCSYGTIRQHQEHCYPDRAIASDLARIDFGKFAEACGGRGFHVQSLDEVDRVIRQALDADGVRVVDVKTSLEAISAYQSLAEVQARGRRRS